MVALLKYLRTLLWFGVLVVVLGLGGWYYSFATRPADFQTLTLAPSSFAKQVTVSGNVTPAQSVDLGFAQGGRVAHVYVAVGDVVHEGDLLAEVENIDARAVVSVKEALLQQQQANLALVTDGTRPEQLAVTQSQIDSDTTALSQANESLRNVIQNAYTTGDDAVHNKVDQFFENPRSGSPHLLLTTNNAQLQSILENDRLVVEAMLSLWQQHVSAGDPANLQGLVTEAQSNIDLLTKLLGDANTVLNAAIPTANVPQSTIAGYITSIALARSSVNTVSSAITTAISAQKNAQAALAKDQRSLQLQQAGATTPSLGVAGAGVSAAKADLENAQAQLVKTQILAPFSGVVSKLDAKKGAIATPNTPLISLISGGAFQIESYVPEVDIANVAVGNPATTTLDAYGPTVFFAARVARIDPAQTVVNGISTYKTTLVFTKEDKRIRSGMTASVTIQTGGIGNALVVPRGALFDRSGQETVQVLQNAKAVDRSVVLGSSSLGTVVITSGLSPGDVVILNPDTTK